MKRGLIAMLANVIDGLVEESESTRRLLIHNSRNGRPLRGTTAGAAEAIEARWHAGNVQVGQDAVQNGAAVCNVGFGSLLSTVKPSCPLLVWRFAKDDAESTASRLGTTEKVLEVAEGTFVPRNFTQVRPRRRIRAGIAAEHGKTVIGGVQLGAAHSGNERIIGGR